MDLDRRAMPSALTPAHLALLDAAENERSTLLVGSKINWQCVILRSIVK